MCLFFFFFANICIMHHFGPKSITKMIFIFKLPFFTVSYLAYSWYLASATNKNSIFPKILCFIKCYIFSVISFLFWGLKTSFYKCEIFVLSSIFCSKTIQKNQLSWWTGLLVFTAEPCWTYSHTRFDLQMWNKISTREVNFLCLYLKKKQQTKLPYWVWLF